MAVQGRSEGETESEITAVGDRALQTKYHATKILQTETEGKCRLCKQSDEAVEQIVSTCPIMATVKYIKRHDTVSAQLHFNVREERGVKLDNKHRYNHVTKSVKTSHERKVTVLWNNKC